MLYGTLELVGLATSNSHFIFCFCNFIIAFLLIGSNSTASSSDDTIDHPPFTMNANSTTIEISKAEPVTDQTSDQSSTPADDADAATEELECVTAEQEPEQEVEEDDDELKRRIEQFIDKINREWKAEKLRTVRLPRQLRQPIIQ